MGCAGFIIGRRFIEPSARFTGFNHALVEAGVGGRAWAWKRRACG